MHCCQATFGYPWPEWGYSSEFDSVWEADGSVAGWDAFVAVFAGSAWPGALELESLTAQLAHTSEHHIVSLRPDCIARLCNLHSQAIDCAHG
jgi:hypothetical protein